MSEESHEGVIVPASAVPPLGGLTPEVLKRMGIDISISKEDLLSVVTQALSDAAQARVEAAEIWVRETQEKIEEKRRAFYMKEVKRVARKPEVKNLAKAMGKHYDHAYSVIRVGDFFQLSVYKRINDDQERANTVRSEPLYVPKDYEFLTEHQFEDLRYSRKTRKRYQTAPALDLREKVKEWKVPEELSSELLDAQKERSNAQRDQRTLAHDTKRAHTRIIRDLLAQTEHGNTLMKMLDSRTLTARVRNAIEAGRTHEAEKYKREMFRRSKGVTHYSRDGKEAVCGVTIKKKTKHTNVPNENGAKEGMCLNCFNTDRHAEDIRLHKLGRLADKQPK